MVLDENSAEEDLDAIEVDMRAPRVTEVRDESDIYCMDFPEESQAGATFGTAKTIFETIQDDQILKGGEVLGPFADDEEWQLAKWLIKNVGHNQAEAFLKLPIVSTVIKVELVENRLTLPVGSRSGQTII